MIVRDTNRDERNFFLIFNQNYNYFSNTSSIRHVIKRYSPLERVTLKLLRIRNAKHPRRNEQRYHCPSSPLGSPHWLPCHEVEGKRSAFFNFPSVDTSLPQINSPENVKYARDSFGHWPRTGNELRNYRCELFVTGC